MSENVLITGIQLMLVKKKWRVLNNRCGFGSRFTYNLPSAVIEAHFIGT